MWRYPVAAAADDVLQTTYPPESLVLFEALLQQLDPAIYHQHTWLQSCGLWHLKAAKLQGIKTVLTVHVPGISCICGTRVNSQGLQCRRSMSLDACGACCLHHRRLPVWLTEPVTKLPDSLNQVLQMIPFPASVNRLLLQQQQITQHIEDIARMCQYADKIIAVCDWLYQVLLACGVPKNKLLLSRQGVAPQLLANLQSQAPVIKNEAIFSLGFIGRCDMFKGIDVLIKAVQAQPVNLKMELVIYALDLDPAQCEDLSPYCREIMALAANDSRIILKSPIAHQQLAEVLPQFDMLAVPSQWLETGPLVVLEAFACNVPVLGSDLGGIAELIHHEQDGFLVPAADIGAWQRAIYRFATEPQQYQILRRGIGKVRNMYDVAEDMRVLYSGL